MFDQGQHTDRSLQWWILSSEKFTGRTHSLFQPGNQEERAEQSLCPHRVDPRRRPLSGRQDHHVVHLLQRSVAFGGLHFIRAFPNRRKICVSSSSPSTTTQSRTRSAITTWGWRFLSIARTRSSRRYPSSRCGASCRRRCSRRRRAVMMRAGI